MIGRKAGVPFFNLALSSIYVYSIIMADKKFTVLDLLELDLPGHDALYLTCLLYTSDAADD